MSVSALGPAPAPQSTIGDPSLPNLSAIIGDTTGAYTAAQKATATQQQTQREYEAFGKLQAGGAVLGDYRAYYRAFINYVDQLSPAEAALPKYAATKASVEKALAAANQAAQAKTQQVDPRVQTLFASAQIAPAGPPPLIGEASILPTPTLLQALGSLNEIYIYEKSGKSVSRTALGLPELTTLGQTKGLLPTHA